MQNISDGNAMRMEISARSDNESFARVVVAAFCTKLNPTLDEIADIKTAVSEAVTNCIVHGYENGPGVIVIRCEIEEETVTVVIEDYGVGIDDVDRAMQPLHQNRNSNAQEWVFHSWRHSWTALRWSQSREKEPELL